MSSLPKWEGMSLRSVKLGTFGHGCDNPCHPSGFRYYGLFPQSGCPEAKVRVGGNSKDDLGDCIVPPVRRLGILRAL